MPYSSLICDLDGTLIQSLPMWIKAFRTVLGENGDDFTDHDIASMFIGTGEEGPKALDLDPDEFYDQVDPLMEKQIGSIQLYPGVRETLAKLKTAGIHLALVTSSKRWFVEPILEKHNLSSLFAIVVTADEEPDIKPNPDGINKVINQVKTKHERTLMLGDTQYDLQAGQAAHVKTALFFPPEHKQFYEKSDLMQYLPDHTVSSFNDLLPLFI